LGLVIYSKRVNAEAELSIAEAVKLEEQEAPKREAERQKKETDDLEAARQKNRQIFHP
jgi:23S rRNA pseudoU1915 N3-methylase RlmH